MSFFRLFPKINYDINSNNRNTGIADIFRSVSVDDGYIDDVVLYRKYRIMDGEIPSLTSMRLYDTPDYHWVFFLINDHLRDGIKNWPLSSYQIAKFIQKNLEDKYVIQLKPSVKSDIDGNFEKMLDSVVGNFQVGEVLEGKTNFYRATMIDIDVQREQILIKPEGGLFNFGEVVEGLLSQNSVVVNSITTLADATYEYRDFKGEVQSSKDIFINDGQDNLNKVTYAQMLHEMNDMRSSINVVNPSFITTFVDRVREKINE